MTKLSAQELRTLLTTEGIGLHTLPYTERKLINHKILQNALEEADQSLHSFFNSHEPIFEYLTHNRLPIPRHLKAIGEEALSFKLTRLIKKYIDNSGITDKCIEEVQSIRQRANKFGLSLNVIEASRQVAAEMSSKLIELLSNLNEKSVADILKLLTFYSRQ